MRDLNQTDTEESLLSSVVSTSQGDYRVVTERGSIRKIGSEITRAGLANRGFLICDTAVYPHIARPVLEALESAGIESHALVLYLGEVRKTLDAVRLAYNWLAEQKAERSDFIISLGGGVTGDLVGFVAATWLRGLPFVNLPTTLAAMVDAAIGGKTGVNLPVGKNLVGAFHQPKLVLEDLDFLASLPKRELVSGWAEVIKHGLILDPELFSFMEQNTVKILSLKTTEAEKAIHQSVAIKAGIVSADEFERGQQRILLNYGHTIGHAIEAVTGYGRFLHGEAVAIGMIAAATIACELGLLPGAEVARQQQMLRAYGLPTHANKIPKAEVLSATFRDKKSSGGRRRWVLLKSLGQAIVSSDVPDNIIDYALNQVIHGDL